MASLALFFFAALSLNLLVNFALGVNELMRRERSPEHQFFYPWVVLFVSTLLLWILFARMLFFTGGIFDYLLVFPCSVLGSMALETLFFYCLSRLKKPEENPRLFSVGAPYNALAAAALFLTLRFALSLADALILSFAFSAGGIFSFLVIKEIQKRSFLEAIPRGLRGTPVLLISLGLLSLMFSAAAMLFLKFMV